MATTHDALSQWNLLDDGQKMAVVKKLYLAGGKKKGVFDRILQGELGIELRDLAIKLMDQNGRPIPPKGFQPKVVDANRQFYHVQPTIDYQAVLARMQQNFDSDMGFMTATEFGTRSDALLEQVRSNAQVSNLLKGPHFSVVIPKWRVGDYGGTFAEKFRPAAERAYLSAFPQRKFVDYLKQEVVGKVRVVDGTRHDQLIERMSEQAVVGIYFPCLQGFGIEADRKIIDLFPEGFLLSGAIDTSVAITAYPEALVRDYNTPVLDCAANEFFSGLSLSFDPSDGHLVFGRRSLDAVGYYAGGVLFVG